MLTGHLGQNQTIDTISKRFYWPKNGSDIKNYVRSCLSCQMRKANPFKPAGYMEYIEVNYPFEKIRIDLLGPFPKATTNARYIIVALDYLTKWAETAALDSGSAEDVTAFFVTNLVLRHGAPKSIISDRRKCFVFELNQKILKLLDTEHLTTTSYHPQTNGLCERLNHTLADMLSMYVNTNHNNWDQILPFVTFAYNTYREESTGYIPFYLMYGRDA